MADERTWGLGEEGEGSEEWKKKERDIEQVKKGKFGVWEKRDVRVSRGV